MGSSRSHLIPNPDRILARCMSEFGKGWDYLIQTYPHRSSETKRRQVKRLREGLPMQLSTFKHYMKVLNVKEAQWGEYLVQYTPALLKSRKRRNVLDPRATRSETMSQPTSSVAKCDLTLMDWLERSSINALLPTIDERTQAFFPEGVHAWNTMVLGCGKTETGYRDHEIRVADADWGQVDALVSSVSIGSRALVVDSKMRGTKAAPLRITNEIDHDDTRLVIEAGLIPYNIFHAFDTRMREDIAARRLLLEQASEVDSPTGRPIPGSLCVHGVVVLGRPTPQVLVAHRPYRVDGFNGDRWSASFEEQFNPIPWMRRTGENTPPDSDLLETLRRGFQEEFLGDERFEQRYEATLHAIELELDGLNIGVIAVIHLPETAFDDIHRTWKRLRPKEHNDIGHFPLTMKSISDALRGVGPGAVGEFESLSPKASFRQHHWDTTSRIRLACCMWLLEQSAL